MHVRSSTMTPLTEEPTMQLDWIRRFQDDLVEHLALYALAY